MINGRVQSIVSGDWKKSGNILLSLLLAKQKKQYDQIKSNMTFGLPIVAQVICTLDCWPPSVRVDYGCVSSWGRHRRLWLCRPILDRQVLPQLLQVKTAAQVNGNNIFCYYLDISEMIMMCIFDCIIMITSYLIFTFVLYVFHVFIKKGVMLKPV